MKIWLQSMAAVLAGMAGAMVVVIALTWVAVLVFFGGDFTAPPTGPYLVLNLGYTFGAAVLAGWIAARLAPRNAFLHAVGVGVVMLAMSAGGGGGETPGASGVPAWYGTALMVLGPLGAVVGGWVQGRAASHASGAASSSPEPPDAGSSA